MGQRFRRFLLGIEGGTIAILVSYAIRYYVGGVFLPEVAVNALVTQTPGAVESVLVAHLQYLAKYSALAGAIGINLVVYGVIGYVVIGNFGRGSFAERVSTYSLIAYGVSLAIAVLLLALTQVLSTPQSPQTVLLSLVLSQLAFGLVLAARDRSILPPAKVICEPIEPVPQSKPRFIRKRRLFIKAGIASAVAGVLLYYGVNLLFSKPSGNLPDTVSTLYNQEVTPNDKFYRVDVDILPPNVDAKTWSLRVSGMVDNPLALTYDQLESMNTVEQYNTLECVSNEIGGDLISTAKWKGAKLKDVLQMAQVRQGATYVVFKAADGYDVGIPMDRALLDGTLLSFEMNGQPLPQEHGFPVRAIVPGLYGMMNCKWVTGIEVVNETYQGYWQRRGWANDAEYHTGSEIVMPGASQIDDRFNIAGNSQVPLGMVPIAGLAFAGDRGIEKVEVSTDNGKTWVPASIKDPLSNYTWVIWTAEWNPPITGDYRIAVRATDKTGVVQTAAMVAPFPNGATGYHVVDIGVVSS
ncbi:MAG: molybdopterin-dependent oxidoreductase [Nitrososphaerales archaeon]|nr:molybdopterin-dependent oxidoreductase [Nitrososphaerales archaeon]